MTAHLAAEPDLVWLAAAAAVAWWLNRRGRLRSLTRRAVVSRETARDVRPTLP